MDDEPAPRKSPYAVPYDRFASDAQVNRADLIVEQPHEAPHDIPNAGDSGDGD
jgi:hypothetical protein